jgi:hypothetical protein
MNEEHSPENAAWGIVDPALDPVQWFKENLSFGSGDIHCVWLPSHPKTAGEHPRPDHAVLLAIVGNGPRSEANAKKIVELWNAKENELEAARDAVIEAAYRYRNSHSIVAQSAMEGALRAKDEWQGLLAALDRLDAERAREQGEGA